MTFDKKFNELSKLVRVILLLIPFVNWIIEILIRVSAVMRNSSTYNIVGLVLGIVGNAIFGWVDLLFVIFKNRNCLLF